MGVVLDQSNTTSSSGYQSLGFPGREYYAQQITIAIAGDIDHVTVSLQEQGTITGNMTAQIFSDDGGGASAEPNVSISDAPTLDVTTLGGTFTEETFTFSTNPTVSIGDKVWIVLYFDGDTTNIVRWENGIAYAGAVRKSLYSADASSWTLQGDDTVFEEWVDAAVLPSTSRMFMVF